MESTDQADPSCFYFRISWVPNYVFSNEDFEFLVKSFHTQFLRLPRPCNKWRGQKNKTKVVPVIHEILK